MSISVPQPIRSWLLRALHTDPRRVFAHAGEAALALADAINECGLRPAPRDLDLQQSRTVRMTPPPSPKPVKPVPVAVPAVKAAPAAKAIDTVVAARRDPWQPHDIDSRRYSQPVSSIAPMRTPLSASFKRLLLAAGMVALMAGAFTAAQFIPAPEWVFSKTGTLVIESSPQGITVLINGTRQGVTPLTLKVEAGVHEVELQGPGKPRIFKVHVTRGDRVAQYVEFPGRR